MSNPIAVPKAVQEAPKARPELDFKGIHYKKLVKLAVDMSAEEGNDINPFIKKKDAAIILNEMNSEGVDVSSRLQKLKLETK